MTRFPSAGFSIHAANGSVIAYREHFEDALDAQRDLDAAEEVRRVADGVLCATKHRTAGPHLYSTLWRLRSEPS